MLGYLRCDAFDLSEVTTDLRLNPFLEATTTVTCLAGALKHNTTVQDVSITDAAIGVEGAVAMASAMRAHSSLAALCLRGTHLGDEGITALSRGFVHHKGLVNLVLEKCGFTEKGAKALASSLFDCNSLAHVSIAENNVRDGGVKHVAEAVSALTTLKSLNVHDTTIGKAGFEALAALVRASGSITFLDASSNQDRGPGMRELGKALLESPHRSQLTFLKCDAFDTSEGVTELHLRGQMLVAGVAPLLSAVAINNRALTAIDISRNGLGPTGASALARGVAGSKSLAKLNVAQNYIEPIGIPDLAKAIAESTSLTECDLSSNALCGVNEDGKGKHITSGMSVLSDAIARCCKLKVLTLDGNRLEVNGAKALAPALRSCTTLRHISLVNNNLTNDARDDAGVEEVVIQATAGALARMGTPFADDVCTLDLSDNHLNGRALEALQRVRKGEFGPMQVAVLGPQATRMLLSTMGMARSIRMHTLKVETPRCKCHYCVLSDEAQQKQKVLQSVANALTPSVPAFARPLTARPKSAMAKSALSAFKVTSART